MIKHVHKYLHRHYRTHYHGVYKHAQQLFVFDLFLLGLAGFFFAASIFFFLWKPGIVDLVDVTVTLGDGRLRSGQTTNIIVAYTNRSKFTLRDATLAIRLPPGFVVNRDETPQKNFDADGTAKLPDISAGAMGNFVIHGWLWSEPKEDDKIIAALSYRPDDRTDREQQLGMFIARLPGSVLEGHLTMASSSFTRQTLPFVYTLTNTSERTLNNLTVVYDWPTQIPELKKLALLELLPGQTITVNGKVTMPNKKEARLAITPTILINGHLIPQGAAAQTINIFQPMLTATARLATDARFAEGGMKLPLELHWENHSSKPTAALRLRLRPTPGTVDLKTTAAENHLGIDGGDLLVDKTMRTALANTGPGGSDTFTVNLTLLPSLKNAPNQATAFEVTPIMEAQFAEIPGELFTEPGALASLPLATELNLLAVARYYTAEGDQLGRGALPPKVGETTSYWLFVEVENTTNPITNIAFSATLGSGARFTGKQSVTIGQPVRFDAGTNSLAWNFAELPAHSHTGLYFEVSVTPGPNDIGHTLSLLKNIAWSATDSVTGKQLSVSKAEIASVLASSDRGSRVGAVVVP